MAFGLTAAGFTAPRAADFLARIQEQYAAKSGLSVGDIKADKVLSWLFTIMADELDTQAEASVAVYDSRRRNNATGIQLDDLGGIIGVPRQEATFSQATVQLDGTAGTVVPSGSIVEGGGDDDNDRWVLQANVTLTGAPDTGVVKAVNAGPVTAASGTIDKIVSAVNGWSSVTNAAAVTAVNAGSAREPDDQYRLRQQQSFAVTGGRSLNALRGQLLALRDADGELILSAAVVLDNDTNVSATVGGVTIDGKALAVIVHPNALTAAQEQLVAAQIYEQTPGGIKTMGTDVTATVTGADGFGKSINFDYRTTANVAVVVTVVLATGFVIGDVEAPLQVLIATHFGNLNVGDPVRILDIKVLAASVNGVTGATVTLDGGGVDIVPSLSVLLALSPAPATVTT